MNTVYWLERTPYETIQHEQTFHRSGEARRKVEDLLDAGYEILAVIQGE